MNEPSDSDWEYIFVSKIMPYIDCIKKWWRMYGDNEITSTGVFPMTFDDGTKVPTGLFVRTTATARRSPIKHVQVFPFIPTSYLPIYKVPGGMNRMIERVCKNDAIKIDGLQVVEKHNLPSTWHRGQFVAFVPQEIYNNALSLGRYIYIYKAELICMANGKLPESMIAKSKRYMELLCED